MRNLAARLWRAMRERMAHWRAEKAIRRAEVTRERAEADRRSAPVESASVLQGWLDCARDDVRREQAELLREREEVARLRAENERLKLDNRALLNSLLGTCGVPPLEVPRTGAETPAVRRPSWSQIAAKREIAVGREAEAARRNREKRQAQGQ